ESKSWWPSRIEPAGCGLSCAKPPGRCNTNTPSGNSIAERLDSESGSPRSRPDRTFRKIRHDETEQEHGCEIAGERPRGEVRHNVPRRKGHDDVVHDDEDDCSVAQTPQHPPSPQGSQGL